MSFIGAKFSVCVCAGPDQVPFSVRGVLLSVEEEVEPECEDPCWTVLHTARNRKRHWLSLKPSFDKEIYVHTCKYIFCQMTKKVSNFLSRNKLRIKSDASRSVSLSVSGQSLQSHVNTSETEGSMN